MKKILLLSTIVFLVFSCDKKSQIEKEVENIPVSIKVERFDKIFYETPISQLGKIKSKYPYFFPINLLFQFQFNIQIDGSVVILLILMNQLIISH